MRVAVPALLILLSCIGCAGAESRSGPDAMTWLKKIAAASRQLNYRGTFVYQHGSQVETSSISHFVDSSGEYERLETLDGPPREVIRNNNNVTCYLPDSKTVVIEKRGARRFPTLLPEQISGIADNYLIKTAEQGRVAGHDCQIVSLEPRDNLRYGHKFCAELVTGLPLRARTYDDRSQMVESFAFTQLTIGAGVAKEMLKSRYAAKSQGWRVDRSALEQKEVSSDTGWLVDPQPTGFKKLMEMKRLISGRPHPVSHIVYSDGFAAISVFVEAMPKAMPTLGASNQGAVNIFIRSQDDQMVTVVGETPARTVKIIAESLSTRGK